MKRTGPQSSITDRLAALGEPIRLRCLRVLERDELSVGELSRVVQLPQSTVSRHLKVLADGGWLIKRTEGTATLYRLILDDLAPADRALWTTVRDQMSGGVGDKGSPELDEDIRRLSGVLNERRTDSEAFFGRVAGEWDAVRNDLFGQRFTPLGLMSLIPRHWAVADLGCGTGNASELLAPVVARVVAVDQSAPMLKAARKRLAGQSNVEFLRAELESLPIPPASVDAAVCILVLHHVADPQKAVSEMRRILKPGGVALVVDMLEHDRSSYKHTMGHRWLGFSEPTMRSFMDRAGLKNIRCSPLLPDPDARGPGLFACTAFAT
ncbi:MAG: metalloregulator ArsR/SmtB family transcription factor [Phycisphaerales bacterium]|nr:metalloregulator ArsR/SmtB family transcription factor [Phycisphaerales bacterium]